MASDRGSSSLVGIGTASRRTGLSPHVLRAWERRYGVVMPVRSRGGDRLYTQSDVAHLSLLARATKAGHAIGQVARLTTEELLALLADDEANRELPATELDPVAPHMLAALSAVESLDGARIHSVLMRAVVDLPSSELVNRLIVPLLVRVGELWATDEICPAHERLLSVNIRRVLAWLIDTAPAAAGTPLLLATTPSEQRHELGAMLVGVIGAEEGWRVAYLGPELPAADIARAARQLSASVVALSVVEGGDADGALVEIARLRTLLDGDLELVVGGSGLRGRAAAVVATGATPLEDLGALRDLLRARRSGAADGDVALLEGEA